MDAANTSTFTGGNVPKPLTTNALITASARAVPAAHRKTAKVRGIFMSLFGNEGAPLCKLEGDLTPDEQS
jgi:hypothetical protein